MSLGWRTLPGSLAQGGGRNIVAKSVPEEIDARKRALDRLRPLPEEAVRQVGEELRIEANYHSNAVEGNSTTLGETRNTDDSAPPSALSESAP